MADEKQLAGTKTEENLKTAFAGESQAFAKYQYYASQAKGAGYVKISDWFNETAHNEHEHAKIWFKLLHGGVIPELEVNLQDAIAGENYEHTTMYKEFHDTAKEEGFDRIAALFQMVGAIEAHHEARYRELLKFVQDGTAFERQEPVAWICNNCGHIHVGTKAPELCPVCAHPKAWFSKQSDVIL